MHIFSWTDRTGAQSLRRNANPSAQIMYVSTQSSCQSSSSSVSPFTAPLVLCLHSGAYNENKSSKSYMLAQGSCAPALGADITNRNVGRQWGITTPATRVR